MATNAACGRCASNPARPGVPPRRGRRARARACVRKPTLNTAVGPRVRVTADLGKRPARALQWLASAALEIPAAARALLLSSDTYQQLHTGGDSLYGVISDLKRDIAEATEETGYLRFVMTEHVLVSGRHHALAAVDATRRSLEEGRRIESVAALFETIIENVADTMDRIAERIARSLDEIEEQVLSDDASDLRQGLGRLRRTCVRLHRQLSGLRIVFHRLEQKNPADLKPALQLRAGKLAQRLDGLDHTIVEMQLFLQQTAAGRAAGSSWA